MAGEHGKYMAKKTSRRPTSRKPQSGQSSGGQSASREQGARRPAGSGPPKHKTPYGKAPYRKAPARKAPTRKPPRKPASAPSGIENVEGGLRLNKLLADHGLASRRAADEMILKGEVHVDGVVVTELGLRVDPKRQLIEVKGVPLEGETAARKRYYVLNKPSGVVCTNEAREVRPRAIDLITDRDKGRIYTVGRLDEESMGLILLTNDGDFANRIMHPRYGISKTYLVKLRGRVEDEELNKLRSGVHLSEGRTAGARIVVRKRTREYTHLLVTLREGMNRELRRIFARVGSKVVDLRRARIGTLTDRGLKIGSWRQLTRAEVQSLLNGEDGEDPSEPQGPRGGGGRKVAKKRTVARRPADGGGHVQRRSSERS